MNPRNFQNENPINNSENLPPSNEQIPSQSQEKYRDIELSPQQRKPVPTPYVSNQPQQQQTPPPQPVDDPVAQVGNMISTGYKPSMGTIQNAVNLIKNNNTEWSDTWFAILLQKLIKSQKR